MIAKKNIDRAASLFNAYNKKLGLADSAHEKYLGTIFTRQQTGFVESLEMPLQGRITKTAKRAIKVNVENAELRLRNVKPADFDKSVKQGRDNMYFLKEKR